MKCTSRKSFRFSVELHGSSPWIKLGSIRTADLLRIIAGQYELHIGRLINWITLSARIHSGIDAEWVVMCDDRHRPGDLLRVCFPKLETPDWNSLQEWAMGIGIEINGTCKMGSYYFEVLIDPHHDFFMLLDLSVD